MTMTIEDIIDELIPARPLDEPVRCERRYDWPPMNSRVSLPEPVVQKIVELIGLDHVHSVSCPYDDYRIWKILIDEQVRRSGLQGKRPQDAFALYGPDGGLWDTPIEEWGGYCHIPHMGLCGGDLLIRPTWRNFRVANGTATGRLSTAASVDGCYYVLSPEDFGEVTFATRELVGNWVLYQSNQPYIRYVM